jgi:two-component system chemotaxis sensor kinase CheA
MDEMDEFKQVFFTECAELLVDMEARLMQLEEGVTDKEQLNAIFRCAHSIKGGSGGFGLDHIMKFTHSLEAMLDKMRDGILVPTRDSINILLKSADIVTQMLEGAKNNQAPVPGYGDDVLAVLQAITNGGAVAPIAAPVKSAPAASAAPVVVESGEPHFTISFKPHEELFATGNDPLLILRELSRLGKATITADASRVPSLEAFDPTLCMRAGRWSSPAT